MRDWSAPGGLPVPQDLLIELFRLELGLYPEVALQHVHAVLVLAKGSRSTPLPDIDAHQCTVRGFLQRIESEQLVPCSNSRLRGARCALMQKQFRQRLHCHLVEMFSLMHQPRFQRFLVDVQSRQEIALIQRCSLLERVGRSLVN